MQENREISALFTLIDDPDEEVFSSVSERIVHYGRGIIPNLENLWENTTRNDVQERIEMIIHRLHYADLVNDLTEWKDSAYHDLLFGALLVAKFQYDIPVRAINIPRQFVLAFFNSEYDPYLHPDNPQQKISFYVDATTGQPFTHKDVENYFKRISVPPIPSYFKPVSKKRIIQMLIEELAHCFETPELLYKKKELMQLAKLLDS